MKKVFAIAALAVFGIASAQKTIELESFTGITVNGKVELKLMASAENKIVINDPNADALKVSAQNGYLSINSKDKTTEATLYYSGNLESITVAGDAEINSANTIKAERLSITAGGGTELNINAEVTDLTLSAASKSEIDLTGSAHNFNAIASEGKLKADEFKTKESCNVTIASKADVKIHSTGMVNATVASGGKLNIYGSPSAMKKTVAKGGEVNLFQ